MFFDDEDAAPTDGGTVDAPVADDTDKDEEKSGEEIPGGTV